MYLTCAVFSSRELGECDR